MASEAVHRLHKLEIIRFAMFTILQQIYTVQWNQTANYLDGKCEKAWPKCSNVSYFLDYCSITIRIFFLLTKAQNI